MKITILKLHKNIENYVISLNMKNNETSLEIRKFKLHQNNYLF